MAMANTLPQIAALPPETLLTSTRVALLLSVSAMHLEKMRSADIGPPFTLVTVEK